MENHKQGFSTCTVDVPILAADKHPGAAGSRATAAVPGESGIVDLHQFSDWLSSTGLSQAIQTTTWAIPGIQTVHILALSVLFAAALLTSLRFAGLGLAAESLVTLAARQIRAIWLMLLVLFASGALLITAEPGRTITNPVFYAKMIMLLLAVIVTLWLASAARRDVRPGPLHVLGAVLCMLLWIGIIFAGRFIAYYESY